MAKKFNPFHHWLGIDESLTQPNHFQLFGVKPNSEDPIGFRKDVHKRAKVMLAKLEQMTPDEIGDRKNLHTKIRRHVVKAHEILMDDKLRAGYLKTLRQKAREAKGSAKPLAVPPPSKSSASEDHAATQTGKHESQTIKQSGTPTIKQKSDVDLPETERSAIPMAIPLSKPDESSAPSNPGEVNFDHLEGESISIRPGRVKRKKSLLIPILLVIMTLFCVAGIGALVTNFGNKITDPVPKTNASNTNPGTTDPATAVTAGNADSGPEKPVVAPTPEEISSATEKLVSEIPERPDEKPKMGEASETESGSDVDPSISEENKLDDSQLSTIRFLFSRARHEMKRARLMSAKKQYDMAEAIIGGAMDPSQADIKKEIQNGRAVLRRLGGFWNHVEMSAREFKGGQLEPTSGIVIGFVEGRERDIVVKIGGEIVSIPHRSMRPGLALELGSKKGAANVPDWRLQQAAFHVVHSDDSGKLDSKIEELLKLAEEDEYPTKEIRAFWKSDLSNVFPAYEKEDFAKDQMKKANEALITGKYESARKVEVQLASQYATDMTSKPISLPLDRAVAFDEAIKLCVRCGNAYQLLDCIDELSSWTNIDAASKKAEALDKIATRFPDAAVPRETAEAFFEFVKSPEAKTLKPRRLQRLIRKFVEFSNGYQLYDLKRLISQTLE